MESKSRLPACPLCHASTGISGPLQAHDRRYLRCGRCGLRFLHPVDRLDPAEERARYETHENSPTDPGYRDFLDRLAQPLGQRLEPGARGLDYGAGPGPTLSVMLEERGFVMAIWDPFFAPDPTPLERSYDFVTCTETVEHFFDVAREWDRLGSLVRPGGTLAVMTEWLPSDSDREFRDWYYVRDPTHTCFYSPGTLRWIAGDRGWTHESTRRNVSFFGLPKAPE